MPYEVHAAARTHIGKVRANNEDSYFVGPRLLLVADGMGGHAAGEVASQITADVFAELDTVDLDSDLADPLNKAIEDATARIAQRVEDDPSLEGMGTTAVGILFGRQAISVVNVGDSRAYLYQRDGRKLTQLTSDDSFVQLMVDQGEITPEQAQKHPYRNIVLKSVNGTSVTPRITTTSRAFGDRYLLCSDGLTDYVELEDIIEGLDLDDLDDCVDRLVDLALDAGAPDNVTVIVAELHAVDADGEQSDAEGANDKAAQQPSTMPIPQP